MSRSHSVRILLNGTIMKIAMPGLILPIDLCSHCDNILNSAKGNLCVTVYKHSADDSTDDTGSEATIAVFFRFMSAVDQAAGTENMQLPMMFPRARRHSKCLFRLKAALKGFYDRDQGAAELVPWQIRRSVPGSSAKSSL